MADNHAFTEEEMEVNEHLGYPKAYGSLCRGRDTVPYSLGPPFTFTPYALQPDEVINLLLHLEYIRIRFHSFHSWIGQTYVDLNLGSCKIYSILEFVPGSRKYSAPLKNADRSRSNLTSRSSSLSSWTLLFSSCLGFIFWDFRYWKHRNWSWCFQ